MSEKTTLTFGDLIAKYMKDNKLKQRDMGSLIGRAQATISAYKYNRQFPETPEELKRLSEVLNVSLLELVNAIEYGRNGVINENYHSLALDLEKLEDQEIRKKYVFTYQGQEITNEEFKKILKLLEFERFSKEN